MIQGDVYSILLPGKSLRVDAALYPRISKQKMVNKVIYQHGKPVKTRQLYYSVTDHI